MYCDATPVYLLSALLSKLFAKLLALQQNHPSSSTLEISDRMTLYRMIKMYCRLSISSQMDIKRNWGSNSGKKTLSKNSFMQKRKEFEEISLECTKFF